MLRYELSMDERAALPSEQLKAMRDVPQQQALRKGVRKVIKIIK
jgi:hypothetical protein